MKSTYSQIELLSKYLKLLEAIVGKACIEDGVFKKKKNPFVPDLFLVELAMGAI